MLNIYRQLKATFNKCKRLEESTPFFMIDLGYNEKHQMLNLDIFVNGLVGIVVVSDLDKPLREIKNQRKVFN